MTNLKIFTIILSSNTIIFLLFDYSINQYILSNFFFIKIMFFMLIYVLIQMISYHWLLKKVYIDKSDHSHA